MASENTPTATKAYLLLSFATMCWGANTVFGKLAVGEMSPMFLVSCRWLGSLMLMLVFANSHVRRDWGVLSTKLVYAFCLGMMGFTGFNVLFYTAAYETTALNIGIIQGSIPVFVLIGTFLLYQTRVAPLQFVGVLATITGVITVASRGDFLQLASLAFNHGDLLVVMACSLYGAYTVGLRKRPASVSALGLFTVLAGAAFIVSLPFSILEYTYGRFYWPTTFGWIIVGLITFFPSFLAQIFFIQGVEKIGPNRAGVFINLVPVFGAAFAVIILGESFEYFHAAALTLVLGGIWLSEHGKRE
ncbi:MAG: DMT family transporter [Rhodospirillales bacterium]|nr:DMT family transporter [Rhodospirillales bacterium]